MARAAPLAAALLGLLSAAAEQTFVPQCISQQCAAEARALAGDGYSAAISACVSKGFGPCAEQAWQCLGDAACRGVVSCGPHILDVCGSDIWRMLTDPKERHEIACVAECTENKTIDPFCVAWKCGKGLYECVKDPKCIQTLECAPKALHGCSKESFDCLFGRDKVCRANFECLGRGLEGCAGPAVNILTDAKVADFVSCAGSKCPHPAGGAAEVEAAPLPPAAAPGAGGAEPKSAGEQLLCMAEKCGREVLTVLEDQDTKELLRCALDGNLTQLCGSVWQCLGDDKCREAVHCWAEPLAACEQDVWHMLTDPKERQALQANAACLRGCEAAHNGDVVSGGFCVLDRCAEDLLACKADAACWSALRCLPATVKGCAMPALDAYVHQPLFADSTKCLALGLESCGRGAVEMLRDQNVAKAVQCAAQCTRAPGARTDVVV